MRGGISLPPAFSALLGAVAAGPGELAPPAALKPAVTGLSPPAVAAVNSGLEISPLFSTVLSAFLATIAGAFAAAGSRGAASLTRASSMNVQPPAGLTVNVPAQPKAAENQAMADTGRHQRPRPRPYPA
jgi:hypothetical protein